MWLTKLIKRLQKLEDKHWDIDIKTLKYWSPLLFPMNIEGVYVVDKQLIINNNY